MNHTRNRRRFLTVLVIVSIFLAGALSGAAVVRLVSRSSDSVGAGSVGAPPTTVARPSGSPSADRPGSTDPSRRGDRPNPVYAFSRILDEELDLTENQRGEIEGILERRREGAREIFRESRSRLQEDLTATIAEVEEVLTAEQVEEFRALTAGMQERIRIRMSAPGDRERSRPDSR